MAKKTGYVEYTCDRCNKREYLKEDGQYANRWYAISRYSADAVKQDRTFCNNCYGEYQDLMSDQDAAYNTFMQNKDGE